METFEIRTHQRTELVEITDQVQTALRQKNVKEGICVVYCPHTTAAITVNETRIPMSCTTCSPG
jgi:secondary thiamine-phosphate synthase enzyme